MMINPNAKAKLGNDHHSSFFGPMLVLVVSDYADHFFWLHVAVSCIHYLMPKILSFNQTLLGHGKKASNEIITIVVTWQG